MSLTGYCVLSMVSPFPCVSIMYTHHKRWDGGPGGTSQAHERTIFEFSARGALFHVSKLGDNATKIAFKRNKILRSNFAFSMHMKPSPTSLCPAGPGPIQVFMCIGTASGAFCARGARGKRFSISRDKMVTKRNKIPEVRKLRK